MAFYRPVPPNPYHWNRVIPGVITDAMTYDEMIAHAMWKLDEIINYLVHSVPYLIDVELNANSDSCTLTGFLYDDYQKKEFNHTFTAGGSADGTYYVNYRTAGPDVQPISETTDPIFVSQEYMPMNCTTLYSFTINNEKIDPASVQFNDLYTGMHNADPDAHKALFDAVYAKIDAEIAEVNEALAAETAARQAADTQLQNNIDAETTARKQADTQLQNNIDAEATAREQADTNLQSQITSNGNDISALTTRVTTAESDITALEDRMGTAETNITGLQTRMGAAETKIANNASAISNETTARKQADTQLQNNIDAEETAREQADTNLQGQITSNGNDISALTTRVTTAESDITALEGQMGTAETNITDLQTRMGKAETNIGNNTSAISNETATRQSEDEALATQISTETQQRKQQDSQLNTSISANAQAIAALNAGTGTVKTVNNLTGAVTLAPGNNVTITPSGNTLTIAATGGGGTAGVSSVNNVTGAVNLVAGSNVSITPSGQNITIAATGGGSAGVASVNGITGPVTISAGSGAGIDVNASGSRITIDNTGVTQLNGVTGNATLVGTGGIEVNAGTSDITLQTTQAIQNKGNWSVGWATGTYGATGFTNVKELRIEAATASPVRELNIIFPPFYSAQYNGVSITIGNGLGGTYEIHGIMYDGEYIVMYYPANNVVRACYIRSAVPAAFKDYIPLARLWISTDASGNILDFEWEGIAYRSIPKNRIEVTVTLQDEIGDNQYVTIPLIKISKTCCMFPGYGNPSLIIPSGTWATLNFGELGFTKLPDVVSLGIIASTMGTTQARFIGSTTSGTSLILTEASPGPRSFFTTNSFFYWNTVS